MPLESSSDFGEHPQQKMSILLQQEVDAIQQQIGQLKNSGQTETERAQAIELCSAGIARLSDNVKDASSYLPAYDQRTYSNAIKDLHESLEGARAALAPKRKFAFKAKPKPVSSTSQDDIKPPNEVYSTASVHSIAALSLEPIHTTDLGSGKVQTSSSAINVSGCRSEWYKVSTADIAVDDQTSGSIMDVKACIVNLSARSTENTQLAKVHIAAARNSLLICGRVSGSTFLSDSEGSMLVADCGQMRLYNCKDCVIYLRCTSNPVIEGCEDIIFAPLPAAFVAENHEQNQRANLWDQVEDFMWLRPEPSPHWKTLAPAEAISDEIWQQVKQGKGGIEIIDTLMHRTGIEP